MEGGKKTDIYRPARPDLLREVRIRLPDEHEKRVLPQVSHQRCYLLHNAQRTSVQFYLVLTLLYYCKGVL
jgi:hypothetical protein